MSEQMSNKTSLTEIRRAAVRYWEKRRIVYNLLLVPPSILSYNIAAISRGGGNDSLFTTPYALLLFAMAAFGANTCYSFVYALEFWFGNCDPESSWNVAWRQIVLICGIILGIILAREGALEIAFMQYGVPAENDF